ncbi:MAG TPA: histidine kinase dimerization/phospho-acceptor domain-containing protein, partial [Steroidobacteraceae bacterium]|nr:histidine kinase dimerization/phospho-acceptor domain-containing protein [Steroidobacteraceae bacterium]
MALERASPSALSHFDPADLLDALSTGIIMLDAQLCPVYANVAAQDLLAFSLNMARGRPFADFLHDAEGLCRILRRALQTGEGIADRELAVRPAGAPREVRTLDVTITPLTGLTGTHLLLELADTTQRQRITRENDLLARLDGSRLMVSQLAHEIKNPLGGLRGAAQLLERELPAAALREYTQVIIAEADRLTALVDSMSGPSRAPSKSELNVHEICEHVYHLLR